MSDPVRHQPLNAAQQARIEFWNEIRSGIYRQLVRLVLTGSGYLLLSLMVGSFLIQMMEAVATDNLYLTRKKVYFFDMLDAETMDVSWMNTIFTCYVLAAAFCLAFSILLLLFIKHRIPSAICSWMARLPMFGSTMECLVAAELCQSVYKSIIERRTYSEALKNSSMTIGNPTIRDWSQRAANQLAEGQALSSVLAAIPLHVPPVSVLPGLFCEEKSHEQALALWEAAAEESHQLAQSRFVRANVFVSNTVILISAFIAVYAMYTTTSSLFVTLKGLA
ncbi:MAG: hypothetical protein P1U77_24810 [Rubripirellula sp.]|nr:hypothetical protein [Rubripirellula sp.]